MDTGGQGIDGSANAPKAMPIRFGKDSEYQNTAEPQSGQKCCSIFRPELARAYGVAAVNSAQRAIERDPKSGTAGPRSVHGR